MHGNVHEWHADTQARYAAEAATDPLCENAGHRYRALGVRPARVLHQP